MALDSILNFVDDFFAIAANALDLFLKHALPQRVERAETQFFQFEANAIDTKTLRDRRVDFQGFAGDAAALRGRQRIECAHVVQAIGELNENYADIRGHRHQHALEVARLGFGVGFEFDLGELG